MGMKPQSHWAEQSRDRLLNGLADAIENHHRQKRRLESEVDPPITSDDNGDFLRDFVHLNVEYMNRLARLGSNYSIIASRALERIYEFLVPNDEDTAPPSHVETDTGIGESAQQSIRISNSSKQDVTFFVRCSRFQPQPPHVASAPSTLKPKVAFRYGPCAITPKTHLTIGPQATLELSFSVELDPTAQRGVTYRAKLRAIDPATREPAKHLTISPTTISVRWPER
jgi:hypothetical protein